ncbi:MAG: DUF456 domain-containing protein [Chloroflexota bacterium]
MDFATGTLFTMALIAMGVGLILTIVVPVLPGQFIIWLAALVYGILTGWETFGLGAFIWLSVIMLAATIIDGIAGWIGAKKGGASWIGVTVGLIAGFVGFIFFNALGALGGTILGIMVYEYYQYNDWDLAWRAAKGYLLGTLVSVVVRVVFSAGMIVLFYWQAT